jgi:phosphate/sulfate permease
VLPDVAVPWWVIVVCAATMVAGAIRRVSAVRWSPVENVAMGWILTFPTFGLIADVTTLLLRWRD